MVSDRAEVSQLRREIARLRSMLWIFQSAMALGPDETWESMAGRIRRQMEDTSSEAHQAMQNVLNLYRGANAARIDREAKFAAGLEMDRKVLNRLAVIEHKLGIIDCQGGLSLSLGMDGTAS